MFSHANLDGGGVGATVCEMAEINGRCRLGIRREFVDGGDYSLWLGCRVFR
jgi:hypothetical protein